MKPKGFYLSYTQINLYYHNPQEYYMQYVLGIKPKPTRPMQYGSIGHQAIADPSFDWRAALLAGRFLGAEERAIERAVAAVPRCARHEVEITATWGDVTLYGIIDGLDDTTFRERKFAAPGAWNQARVDDDLQLTFYWWLLGLTRVKIKRAYLDHINSKTGTLHSFETTRNKTDLQGVENLVEYCYKGIKAENWGA